MVEAEITNITDASNAVAKAPRTTIATMADGTKVVIRKLSWMHFEELWNELGSAVALIMQDTPLDTEGDQGAAITEKLMQIPSFLVKFISLTTDFNEEAVRKFEDFGDVLDLGQAVIAFNEPSKVVSFFTNVVGSVMGSGEKPATK